jgi:cyclopropane fatty-acyl-phospholipid synthase-like methyltransferase
MDLPDRGVFESAYAKVAPWDIDGPQPVFVSIAGRISGAVLDSGCGTGENSLYLAGRGCHVTGIDFLAEPIQRAKQKSAQRGIAATFLVMDALHLSDLPQQFDAAIDSGLFHVFSDDDRRRYVAGLATVLRPGGRLFLLCFSDAEPGTIGPRRVTKQELERSFADGWQIDSIEPARFQIRPDFKEFEFSPGGPMAWFMIATRSGSEGA